MEERLTAQLAKALAEYGPETVIFAWDNFFGPYLKVAQALLTAKDLTEIAHKAGLTFTEASEAMVLLGHLKLCNDPHHAWTAAEILLRYTKDLPMLLTACKVDYDAAKQAGRTEAADICARLHADQTHDSGPEFWHGIDACERAIRASNG